MNHCTIWRISLIASILLIILVACNSAAQTTDPAKAVEGYLAALVERDLNQMINRSCADWEAQARVEYDSFAAVKLNLQDLQCQTSGQEGEYTLIACTGSIIANYGAEDLQIDVANQTYRVRQEGGEWRMCGYHQP